MERRLGIGLCVACVVVAICLVPVSGEVATLTDQDRRLDGPTSDAVGNASIAAGETPDSVVVAVEGADGSAVPTDRVREAMAYWTNASDDLRPVLASDLPTQTDVEPWVRLPTVEPDVVLRVADERLSCGEGDGPAHFCTDDAAGRPATATISPGLTDRGSRAATTAALGRVLDANATVDGPDVPERAFTDPWPARDRVTVNVENDAGSRDVEPLVAETLRWWEQHDDEYGNYTTDWKLVDDPDADVTVSLVSEVQSCGSHPNPGSLLGCAPVLDADSLADGDEHVRIRAGYTDETTLLVLKHEFGHVYGRSHGMTPEDVMAARLPTTRLSEDDATDQE